MSSPLDDLLDLGLGAAFARDEAVVRPAAPLPERIGRYMVRSRLGEGGLGVVYLGRDEELGRDVAIKVLHDALAADAPLLARFRDEARTSSQLQHPGIVPVHEVGRTEDGRHYYTMRVVAGETLRAMLATGGSRDRRRLLAILERAAEAVAYAHNAGIVHGDLTPTNIMVGEFGEVQVLDWGWSRRNDAPAAADPAARAVGTPAYMAPEQAHPGQRVDCRTDVFGLGAILCHILTGSPPYVGASVFQVHQRAAEGALGETTEKLDAVVGDHELVALTRRCLAVDPQQRPADAAAVAAALTNHLQEIEARARRFELEAAEQRARAVAARRARRLAVSLAALVVGVVVVGTITWSWWVGEREQRRTRANARALTALGAARQQFTAANDQAGLRTALTAAVAAEEATAAADVDAGHVATAAALRADLEAALARTQRDEATRERLVDLRWHPGDDRPPAEIEEDYRVAFARCDVPIQSTTPDVVAAAIRSHALHQELTSALHWWALLRRSLPGAAKDTWRALFEVADATDRDPRRTDLRRAFLDGDAVRLRKLASEPATLELAPATIDLLGQFLVADGDRSEAIELYRRAHLRYPHDYELCHDLATLLVQQPHPPLAEVTALMQIGAALRPDHPHALVDFAWALVAEHRFEAARPLAARAVALDAGYARAWYVLALIEGRDGDTAGALAAAQEYARRESAGPRPRLFLSRMFEANGMTDEAIAACREAVAAKPDWGEAVATLGRLLGARGDLLEAIDVLEKALPVVRDRAALLLALGQTWQLAAMPSRAVESLREALGLRARDPFVQFHLGVALAAVGQLDEAIEMLEAASEGGREVEGWPHSSAYLDHARLLASLEGRLAAFQRDQSDLDLTEVVLLADLAMSKGLHATAAELFSAAIDDRSEREGEIAERFGRAAARAAFANESPRTADTVRWGETSLRLLRGCLDGLRNGGAASETARRVRTTLAIWSLASELAATRDETVLAGLPPAQRDGWRGFWADVGRLQAEAKSLR